MFDDCTIANQFLQSSHSESQLFSQILRMLWERNSVDWAGIYQVDDEQHSIIFNAEYAWSRRNEVRLDQHEPAKNIRSVSWKAGIVGHVARTQKVFSNLGDQQLRDKEYRDVQNDFGPANNIVAIPFTVHGRCIAVLVAGTDRSNFLSPDLVLMQLLVATGSAHFLRLMREREQAGTNRSLHEFMDGLSASTDHIAKLKKLYGIETAFNGLSQFVRLLISADAILILTYDPRTNGLNFDGCHTWIAGKQHLDIVRDNILLDLIRRLRLRTELLVEPDLVKSMGGPFWEFAQRFSVLSAIAAPLRLNLSTAVT